MRVKSNHGCPCLKRPASSHCWGLCIRCWSLLRGRSKCGPVACACPRLCPPLSVLVCHPAVPCATLLSPGSMELVGGGQQHAQSCDPQECERQGCGPARKVCKSARKHEQSSCPLQTLACSWSPPLPTIPRNIRLQAPFTQNPHQGLSIFSHLWPLLVNLF